MKLLSLYFLLCFSILPGLTLEEKVGQLLLVHFHGESANVEARRLIQEAHVGGFIYFNWSNGLTSKEQVSHLSESLQSLAKIPLWISIDQEGGPVTRLKKGFPEFPGNREMAKGSLEQAEDIAKASGDLLRELGISMNFAPVVDVSQDCHAYIASRTFGDTPELVIRYGERVLQGYKRAGVVAVMKHFPGYGSVELDPHRGLPQVKKSLAELKMFDLAPFKALANDSFALMTAHIMVPALDEKNCATLSKKILGETLRGYIGFKGIVISDSLIMQGLLSNCGVIEEAAIRAINAGCDLLLLGGKDINQEGGELTVEDTIRIYQALLKAVKEGLISLQRLDEAVKRSLELKEKFRIGSTP